MLINLFGRFSAPRRTIPTPRYRPAGAGEEHFNLLVSLQMAVRDDALVSEKGTAADMLHGANDANLRKQVDFSFSLLVPIIPPCRPSFAGDT